MGLFFPCVLLGGAAWPPSLGAVAFFLFFSVVLPPFHSFGSWCFATPHEGLGVGVLGVWVGCWVVGFGVGVWLLSVGWGGGWLRGWGGVQCLDWCWGVLESMFSCLGSNDDENDIEE